MSDENTAIPEHAVAHDEFLAELVKKAVDVGPEEEAILARACLTFVALSCIRHELTLQEMIEGVVLSWSHAEDLVETVRELA